MFIKRKVAKHVVRKAYLEKETLEMTLKRKKYPDDKGKIVMKMSMDADAAYDVISYFIKSIKQDLDQ